MRALTIQNPWAWAIVYGGKDVENRATGIVGTYRGPVLIHAGSRWSPAGEHDERVAAAYFAERQRQGWLVVDREGAPKRAAAVGLGRFVKPDYFGAFIGVADLINEHASPPHSQCCSEWGDPGAHHLTFANPRPIAPVPYRGRLGLWTPPADALDRLEAVIA